MSHNYSSYDKPNSYGQDSSRNGMNGYGQYPGPRGGGNDQYSGMDFAAPVIHMGGGRGGDRRGGGDYNPAGRRAGLGMEGSGRDRHEQISAQPPTREEIARTIFIGGLGEGAPSDEVLEYILKSPGKLRRWLRAKDASGMRCRFGFAEYEDVDSLEAAKAAFDGGFEVPKYTKEGQIERDEEGNVVNMSILCIIDEQSSSYIDEWMARRKETEDARTFRAESAKDDFRQCITGLLNGMAVSTNHALNGDSVVADVDMTRDEVMVDQDELSDIPPEQRATIQQEIKNFRERAKRLDVERLRREDEIKAADLSRSRQANQVAPVGPANGTSRITGAPSGPKGYRGVQLPSEYRDGVKFVGSGIDEAEDSSDASDTELEKRKKAQRDSELEREYNDAERRWLHREKQRLAANERETAREKGELHDIERRKEQMAQRLTNWNDAEEDRLGREDFYADRSRWAAKRAKRREAEAREDELDRQAEQEERRQQQDSRSAAEQFMQANGADIAAAATRHQPAATESNAFKVSLKGVSLKRNKDVATKPKRTMADVAGFLDDEDDEAANAQQRGPRAIAQAEFDDSKMDLTEDERAMKRKELAAEIPSDTKALFAREVRWKYIDDGLLEREIRPFVNKKVLEYLGVQEDFLVDMVIAGLKAHKDATALVDELAIALEDEAEVLVKKVWRLVVFWAEAESRGLN